MSYHPMPARTSPDASTPRFAASSTSSVRRGSVVIFDSMLVHRAGTNRSNAPRRAVNHQYTRPFVKQQMDLAHMMRGRVDPESRLAQVLGLWSVPPKSLEEFRVDPPRRTYRAGQG